MLIAKKSMYGILFSYLQYKRSYDNFLKASKISKYMVCKGFICPWLTRTVWPLSYNERRFANKFLVYMFFSFYKHTKIWSEAQLCLTLGCHFPPFLPPPTLKYSLKLHLRTYIFFSFSQMWFKINISRDSQKYWTKSEPQYAYKRYAYRKKNMYIYIYGHYWKVPFCHGRNFRACFENYLIMFSVFIKTYYVSLKPLWIGLLNCHNYFHLH